MGDGGGRTRTILLTVFPMFIATLSLVTSIYNGYLNNRFVELIQTNVSRVEYMKTCKEIIDAYFHVRFRAERLSAMAESERAGSPADPKTTAEQIEAHLAVNKFGALGTYLANLRDEKARSEYTKLTAALQGAIDAARRTKPSDIDGLFRPANAMFGELNNDCVKSAKG